MNVWTWNVNSIRSKILHVNSLLKKHDVDVLIVTETKIKPDHEPMVTQQINTGYSCIWNSNKNSYYHGVGIIHKKGMRVSVVCSYLPRLVTEVDQKLCVMRNKDKVNSALLNVPKLTDDMEKAQKLEGRILTVKITNQEGIDTVIVATYVPNSGVTRGDTLRRLGYRVLVWDKDMYKYLQLLEQKYRRVIWVGDLNVAHKDNDMNRKANTGAGTTPEERHNIDTFINQSGWIDSWDHANPTVTDYHKRWTYGVEKSRKLRLDYVICSPQMKECIVSSTIDHTILSSDHVPIGTQFR